MLCSVLFVLVVFHYHDKTKHEDNKNSLPPRIADDDNETQRADG